MTPEEQSESDAKVRRACIRLANTQYSGFDHLMVDSFSRFVLHHYGPEIIEHPMFPGTVRAWAVKVRVDLAKYERKSVPSEQKESSRPSTPSS